MPAIRSLPYLDVELVLTTWLQAQLAAQARVVTKTPSTFGAVPVVQVKRIGGASAFTLDNPRVDVNVFAATEFAATALANTVRMLLEQQLPRTTVPGGSVGAVSCDSGPSVLPYANTTVTQAVASYQMAVHASQ